MSARIVVALALATLVGNGVSARANDADLNVGDHLVLKMTGGIAKEYARRTDSPAAKNPPAGLVIQVPARIVEKLDDGRLRVMHGAPNPRQGEDREGEETKLLTVSTIVKRAEIAERVTPAGTRIHASPGSKSTTVTEKETRGLLLTLSDLERVQFRVWTFAKETDKSSSVPARGGDD